MLLKHLLGLLLNPLGEWRVIRDSEVSALRIYLELLIFLAAIPPVAAFIGTTQVGWQVGWGDPVKLTVASALPIAVVYYLVILVAVFVVGKAIHWMAVTYGAEPSFEECLKLAAFTATPMLLLGAVQIYPLLWFDFLVGLIALAYTVRLLFTGVPILMRISPERGFLFSSSVLTFGLVALVAMLAMSALLWSVGFGPEFTY